VIIVLSAAQTQDQIRKAFVHGIIQISKCGRHGHSLGSHMPRKSNLFQANVIKKAH
jgi:hypothetical protein